MALCAQSGPDEATLWKNTATPVARLDWLTEKEYRYLDIILNPSSQLFHTEANYQTLTINYV